nr:immunoglobulin light chain junction region [Macaca mulatta]
CQQHNTNPFTF